MRDSYLEERFPKLRGGRYSVESPRDPSYNCVAFAIGNPTRFWQWMPRRTRGYYWPIDWDNTLGSWEDVFRIHGYTRCESADFEHGIEKIAIYVDSDNVPNHVAKQDIVSGKWVSKLGRGKDISHDTLDVLAGDEVDEYGAVGLIMMRPYRGALSNEQAN